MIKIETIQLLEGFGNETPKRGEYTRGSGVYKGDNGIIVGRGFTQMTDGSGLPGISKIIKGRGLGYVSNANNPGDYLYAAGASDNRIFQSWFGLFGVEAVYRVMNQNWFGLGFIVDPKGRVLYPGGRYIGMFDPTLTNYYTGSVSVTNGSTAVVGTGTMFVAGDVGKVFRIVGENGVGDFYKVSAFTDATHITLASAYQGTTGSGKSYLIMRAWTDQWKDFGTDLFGTITDVPCDVYEDTVLFGRGNNITSLNVTTDTITTDAVPAFDTPSGFVCRAIVANTTGILLGFNFQGRGILMLWDNYSDRSIAPWLHLDDALLAVYRAESGWIVFTSKAIYFTNGYSMRLIAEKLLGSSNTAFYGPSQYNGFVLGNQLHYTLNWDARTRRAGMYKMDIKTGLSEYYSSILGNQYDGTQTALAYIPDFSRIYGSSGATLEYLSSNASVSKTYLYESGEIGQGANTKVAEGIDLPLSVGRAFPTNVQKYSFTIEAKINTLDRPLYAYGQVKTTSTVLNKVKVDESTTFNWPLAQVGDEIEFVKCTNTSNQSVIRTITAIANAGTTNAEYTLDSDLPAYATASDTYVLSGFKSIEKKVYTDITSLPETLYFDIKNRHKAKSFVVKFVVTNCNIPLELQPFKFVYDDLGPLQ